MIPAGEWKRWKKFSTTDDRLTTYVLSDIRIMLGTIERQHSALKKLFMLTLTVNEIRPDSSQMREAGRIIAEVDAALSSGERSDG